MQSESPQSEQYWFVNWESFCHWSGRCLQKLHIAGPCFNLSKNLYPGICEHSSAVLLAHLWILKEISALLFTINDIQLPRNGIHSQTCKNQTHRYSKIKECTMSFLLKDLSRATEHSIKETVIRYSQNLWMPLLTVCEEWLINTEIKYQLQNTCPGVQVYDKVNKWWCSRPIKGKMKIKLKVGMTLETEGQEEWKFLMLVSRSTF